MNQGTMKTTKAPEVPPAAWQGPLGKTNRFTQPPHTQKSGHPLAGYYRAIERRELTLDLVVGVRHLDIEQTLDWTVTGNVGSIPVPGRASAASW